MRGLVEDPETEVRNAALSVGRASQLSARRIAFLRSYVRPEDASARVRRDVASVLPDYPKLAEVEALDIVRALGTDDDIGVRENVAKYLAGHIAYLDTLDSILLEKLATNDKASVRSATATTLAREGCPAAHGLLGKIMDDPSPDVLVSLGMALTNRPQKLDSYRLSLAECISRHEAPEVRRSLASLAHHDLGGLPPQLRQVVIALAHDPDKTVQTRIGTGLALHFPERDAESRALVQDICRNGHEDARAETAVILAQQQRELGEEGWRLVGELRRGKNPLVRDTLEHALGAYADDD